MDNQNPGAWCEKRAVVIILIIVFFPIGILMLWKSRKFSRNAKVALSTCVGILVIAGAIFDQGAEIKQDNQTAAPSVAKPDATVITAETTPVTVEPKNSLEEEIAELRSEFQQLNAEMRVLERDNPTFYIQGEIQGWDGDTVHIWGQSQPCNSDITTLGTLIESGNIILRNPDISQKNKRVYLSIDCGLHYFKEIVQSKNRLGYPVDVYVFGPQPKEIKETYIKLSDLIKKRKSVGAQWLKKKLFDSKPVTDETEAKTKLLALNAFLEKNKEFKEITIGSNVNAVEKLKPDTLYDRYNDFAFHIFKDDGVIIQSKFEEVVAITWIFDVNALFQYYTYLRDKSGLRASFSADIPRDAPLLSKHNFIEKMGWENGAGNVSRIPELYNMFIQPNKLSDAPEYTITCQSNEELTNILAITMVDFSNKKIGFDDLPLSNKLVDYDPVLQIDKD